MPSLTIFDLRFVKLEPFLDKDERISWYSLILSILEVMPIQKDGVGKKKRKKTNISNRKCNEIYASA